MFGISNEWVWVALIGVVLFGASNIPKLAKNLGEGIREFKKSTSGAIENQTTSASATPDVREK